MNIQCAHDELVLLSELKPNPRNRNVHSADQIERLTSIIEAQGQRMPIVVSTRSGFITKGHGRLEAIKKLGWEKAAVDFQDYETEEAEYADMVADNAIADWSVLDFAGINSDLESLGPNFDLDALGLKGFKLDVAEKEEAPKEKQKKTKECPSCGYEF